MKNDSPSQDGWWHERQTRFDDLKTGYQPLEDSLVQSNGIWQRAALVVGLMFALVVSLVVMASR